MYRRTTQLCGKLWVQIWVGAARGARAARAFDTRTSARAYVENLTFRPPTSPPRSRCKLRLALRSHHGRGPPCSAGANPNWRDTSSFPRRHEVAQVVHTRACVTRKVAGPGMWRACPAQLAERGFAPLRPRPCASVRGVGIYPPERACRV